MILFGQRFMPGSCNATGWITLDNWTRDAKMNGESRRSAREVNLKPRPAAGERCLGQLCSAVLVDGLCNFIASCDFACCVTCARVTLLQQFLGMHDLLWRDVRHGIETSSVHSPITVSDTSL